MSESTRDRFTTILNTPWSARYVCVEPAARFCLAPYTSILIHMKIPWKGSFFSRPGFWRKSLSLSPLLGKSHLMLKSSSGCAQGWLVFIYRSSFTHKSRKSWQKLIPYHRQRRNIFCVKWRNNYSEKSFRKICVPKIQFKQYFFYYFFTVPSNGQFSRVRFAMKCKVLNLNYIFKNPTFHWYGHFLNFCHKELGNIRVQDIKTSMDSSSFKLQGVVIGKSLFYGNKLI